MRAVMWFGYSCTGKKSRQWWNPDFNIFASMEPIPEPLEVPRCKWLIAGGRNRTKKE